MEKSMQTCSTCTVNQINSVLDQVVWSNFPKSKKVESRCTAFHLVIDALSGNIGCTQTPRLASSISQVAHWMHEISVNVHRSHRIDRHDIERLKDNFESLQEFHVRQSAAAAKNQWLILRMVQTLKRTLAQRKMRKAIEHLNVLLASQPRQSHSLAKRSVKIGEPESGNIYLIHVADQCIRPEYATFQARVRPEVSQNPVLAIKTALAQSQAIDTNEMQQYFAALFNEKLADAHLSQPDFDQMSRLGRSIFSDVIDAIADQTDPSVDTPKCVLQAQLPKRVQKVLDKRTERESHRINHEIFLDLATTPNPDGSCRSIRRKIPSEVRESPEFLMLITSHQTMSWPEDTERTITFLAINNDLKEKLNKILYAVIMDFDFFSTFSRYITHEKERYKPTIAEQKVWGS